MWLQKEKGICNLQSKEEKSSREAEKDAAFIFIRGQDDRLPFSLTTSEETIYFIQLCNFHLQRFSVCAATSLSTG